MLRRTALTATVAAGVVAIGGIALVVPTGADAASPDPVVAALDTAAGDPTPDGTAAAPARRSLLTDAER
ncbi:MAG: hypothetical protein JWN31_1167, partial [Frankiales bacterium]|nr:hypothetical protein [Frankiales bacterium]